MRTTPLPILALLLVAACTGPGDRGGPLPAPQPQTTVTGTRTGARATNEPIDGTFALGDGRHLYLACTGGGSPVVLLEADDDEDSSTWGPVLSAMGSVTRVCAYDRAGLGRSDAATGCRLLSDLNGDLEALLAAAGVAPPYVLVGAGGGGYLAAGYARAHPDQTAGIVLLGTMPAHRVDDIPPARRDDLECDAPGNRERRDFVGVEWQAYANRRRLGDGDLPVVLVTHDYGTTARTDDERYAVENQKEWMILSRDAQQVVVTSGPDLPQTNPKVVRSAILQVVRAARST